MLSLEYCEPTATKLGADPTRAVVWHAFSNFYMDSAIEQNDLREIESGLAVSPFSIAELAHIALYEVLPVCWINKLLFLGSEWLAFDNEWLIPRCLAHQKNNPYIPGEYPKQVPFLLKLAAPLYSESYLMICRVSASRERISV